MPPFTPLAAVAPAPNDSEEPEDAAALPPGGDDTPKAAIFRDGMQLSPTPQATEDAALVVPEGGGLRWVGSVAGRP